MDWLPWTGLEILKTLVILASRSPSDNTAAVNSPEDTTPGHCKAFFFGSLNHHEDFYLLFLTQPPAFYLSHEPPFVFFRKIASSTACSAKARSFSSNSLFSAS
jgi:hypothetical protein